MSKPVHETKTIAVQHVTIRSDHSFAAVKTKLERLVSRIDDGIFTLLRYGETGRALKELEALPTLSIFGFRDHGALLGIAGPRRHAIQYDIGSPLTASKMTRHDIAAALYAPIRVLLREDQDGAVSFEYDRPVSVFGQFNIPEIDAVAVQLDKDLRAVLEQAVS
ncbi:DUF302 domain-containing protein [Bordetella bronchialis]|uniref:DUF302 domain-containing protein n=1 Tax=Bordetella bronchialis TaxID=463025 RepID=A0A193FD01_9BORD|nr:DUF302 domain-containing protein [Bordetella bronchialis]ANN65410.1 hypothetical protein BAU06_03060 [Bordetella bronchialis]ANN70442.1 hypothetical protein BAU08_03035 [Bordetella bronchialis]